MELSNQKPDIRRLFDIKEVVMDQKWLESVEDIDLYFMYRGQKEESGIRYDITVIPPRMMGKEFVKTLGHEHIGLFPEIYIVQEGQAIYLMQKRNENDIEDVFAVEANPGQCAIIPAGYGHVTINPLSDKKLQMANWLSSDCKSDYSSFLQRQGACYYYTEQGWIKNEKYGKVPELRFEKPLNSVPDNLDFLKTK